MKFMIVDDEPIVREGLKTLIDWSVLGFELCGEASDGSEAVIKIIELNPDLVMLDIKIPELSGIEVAEIIRKKGYDGKIIILSGFSDFTYAQIGIRYGVEAYLLKPVDESELISALLRVKEKIEQENIMELYNNQNQVDTKNMLLKHLLTGYVQFNHQNFESYGLTLNVRPFQLVMIDYSHYNEIEINRVYGFWKKLYTEEMTEFVIIEKSIILLIKGLPSIQYFTNYIVSSMGKEAEDKLLRPLIIISDTFDEVIRLPEIYQKLKSIINRRFFYYEKNKPIFYKNLEYIKSNLSTENLSPIEFIESIYKAILEKDSALIQRTVNKLYYVLQNRDFTIEQTFQILINCIVELKVLLSKTYIKELIEFNETELISEICNNKILFEIMKLLNDKFILFSDYVKKSSEVNIIEKILNYIDIHYNEDIKLEKIAELFGYNAAYLGRLLSSHVGTNFNLYIEKKRLDKAIDMIINTDIKISDISILIGYQNLEYFYRKFKKYTKHTPGNFRLHYSDANYKKRS